MDFASGDFADGTVVLSVVFFLFHSPSSTTTTGIVRFPNEIINGQEAAHFYSMHHLATTGGKIYLSGGIRMYTIDASYETFSEVDGQCTDTDNGATNPRVSDATTGILLSVDGTAMKISARSTCAVLVKMVALGVLSLRFCGNESAPMDGISTTWEGGVKVVGDSVFFAFRRGGLVDGCCPVEHSIEQCNQR